jgi:glycosyltransferase involved in cell wall biosynthesis
VRRCILVVVIPALNEARTLRGLVEQVLRETCPEVIVVDDGSDDGTAATVSDLPITVLRHEQRMGKGASLRDGFALALERGADGVLTMDADGQHAASDIPRLRAAWRAHPDRIVIGARLIGRERQPRSRRRANAIADFCLSWATGRRHRRQPERPAHLSPRRARAVARAQQRRLRVRSRHADGVGRERHPLGAGADRGALRARPPAQPLRAGPDIARITRQVGARVFGGGMMLGNLWRIRGQEPRRVRQRDEAPDSPQIRRQWSALRRAIYAPSASNLCFNASTSRSSAAIRSRVRPLRPRHRLDVALRAAAQAMSTGPHSRCMYRCSRCPGARPSAPPAGASVSASRSSVSCTSPTSLNWASRSVLAWISPSVCGPRSSRTHSTARWRGVTPYDLLDAVLVAERAGRVHHPDQALVLEPAQPLPTAPASRFMSGSRLDFWLQACWPRSRSAG